MDTSKARLKFSAGSHMSKIQDELNAWNKENKVKRLWEKDSKLWTGKDESKWMGWLDITLANSEVDRIHKLTQEVCEKGYSDVVLLGMGGSSLCPAMMAETFKKSESHPKLHILDSTNPDQIQDLEQKINLEKSFFIVSSKSGTTLEPNIYKEYFFTKLQEVFHTEDVGEHFAAVTDPGTALEKLAQKDKFKAVFHGIPSIGGRYSALSNFGLVPSGLMGVDIAQFLKHAETMKEACGPNVSAEENPGVVLGVILGVCAKAGKDKITLIASPGIHALGAWLEQLIAESTGKEGKGLIPLDQEPFGDVSSYSKDRIFAYIRLNNESDEMQDKMVDAIEQAGHVVVRMSIADKMHLSEELFRWELATAVAGSIIGIDAFNQPDVEASKVLSAKISKNYEETGKFEPQEPFCETDHIQLASDDKNVHEIRESASEESLEGYIKAHFNRVKENDYINISAFLEMNDEHTKILQDMREYLRNTKKVATCLGFGPRFLHSTGQAYKGGPNSGVFLQIIADAQHDLQVPNHKYTFGFVIKAQAEGDFEVLTQRDRRVLRVYLDKDVTSSLEKLREEIFKI